MKIKPVFKRLVRPPNTDAVPLGQGNRIIKVIEFIFIENSPNMLVHSGASAQRIYHFLNQCRRSPSNANNFHINGTTVFLGNCVSDSLKILGFRLLTFRNNVK